MRLRHRVPARAARPENETSETADVKERPEFAGQENTIRDGRYQIPTFEEVVALAQRNSTGRARPIGIYPETKHRSYFDSIGLSLEEPLVQTLCRHGLHNRNAPVFIQSFATENLRDLNRMSTTELRAFHAAGLDGVCTDQPDLAVLARQDQLPAA